MSSADVVVVGGGPAGLTAAVALVKRGVERVVVLERESDAGGVPRHTDHLGFGMRDRKRVMRGPAYARALRGAATDAGVEIRVSSAAIAWSGDQSLEIADESGVGVIEARAIVLATGVRERPRSARLVPGDRGAGIYTTGSLQQVTALRHEKPGTRAVIVGAEHVSFSAVLTLRHAGCSVAAMVTPHPRHQTYRTLRMATAAIHRVPVITGADIAAIRGRGRVEAVTLTNGRDIECDTVVFTGDWIPDHELARRGAIVIDPTTKGPVIDGGGRTSRAGVFAVGNLVHPAETADVCSLHGRHIAVPVLDWLTMGEWPQSTIRIRVTAPLAWISPAAVDPLRPAPRDRFVLRTSAFVDTRTIAVSQGDRNLWHGTVLNRSLVPNRSISIASGWIGDVDPAGDDVVVSLQD